MHFASPSVIFTGTGTDPWKLVVPLALGMPAWQTLLRCSLTAKGDVSGC